MSGIPESLERKIQALLDQGLSPSEELGTVLEGKPEAMQLAKELEKLDRVLQAWGPELVGTPDLDPYARRIEQRLDETLPPLEHDPTLPPAFDDEDSWRRPHSEGEVGHSGEYALSALTDHMSDPSSEPAAAPPAPAFEQPPRSEVVQLAERRKTSYWFAAAAVLGLATTGGIFMMQDNASEPMAMSTSEEADSMEAPAAQAAPVFEPALEPMLDPTPEPIRAPAESEALSVEAATEQLEGGVAQDLLRGGGEGPRRRGRTMRAIAPPASEARVEAPIGMFASMTSMASKRPTPTGLATGSATGSADVGASVVRRTRTRVEACFASVPARLDVEVWVDGATGRVRDAQVRSGSSHDESECVRRVVRSAVFPEREGVSRFTVHLRYRPGPPRDDW